jgi:putative membrane protein
VHSHTAESSGFLNVVLALGVALIVMSYVASALWNRKGRPWPLYRSGLWIAGMLAAVASVVGPIARASHESLTAHMVGHLLLGMLAPLLLVLAAPITLALRTLDVVPARRLSALLKTPVVRFFLHPVTATVLNVGGLWAVYATGLYHAMHNNMLLMLAVHVHVFVAGYLFTASLIGVDPRPHRPGYLYRAIVMIVALAGHDILAKCIYAHPPTGVPVAEAQEGSMIMYYGGDAIDLVVIIVLCSQWFAATRPKPNRHSRHDGLEADGAGRDGGLDESRPDAGTGLDGAGTRSGHRRIRQLDLAPAVPSRDDGGIEDVADP